MLNRLINYFYPLSSKSEEPTFQPHPSWLILNRLKAELEQRDENQSTPLLRAVDEHNLPEMRRLIQLGANIEARGNHQFTPLAVAAYTGFCEGVRYLLANHADMEAMTIYARRSLAWAVIQGHAEIVQLLLAAGADPNLPDETGFSAHMIADDIGNPDVLCHFPPLQLASMQGSDAVITPDNHEEMTSQNAGNDDFSASSEEIDSVWMDPVTYDEFKDPVTVPSGYTYSRKTLISWFQQHDNPPAIPCPMTRLPIPVEALTWGETRVVKEAMVREKQAGQVKRVAEVSPEVSPRQANNGDELRLSSVRNKRLRFFDTKVVSQADNVVEPNRVRLAAGGII